MNDLGMKYLVEMHCHIIPGVDDGAQDMETSMAMLERYIQEGVTRIICTPHYRPGFAAASPGQIVRQYEAFTDEADARGFGGKALLYLGCEAHDVTDVVDGLTMGRVATMAQSEYVLIEFRYDTPFFRMQQTIRNLQMAGFYPIVAHAERYEMLLNHRENLDNLVSAGALIQLNAPSVLGKLGRSTAKFCKELLADGQVHFVASDAHNMTDRAPMLAECSRFLERTVGETGCKRLLVENPEAIIYNEPLR